MGWSKPALLLSTVPACCAIVLPSFSLSACLCVCIYVFIFSLLKTAIALPSNFLGYYGVQWRVGPKLKYSCFSRGFIWLRAWAELVCFCFQRKAIGPAHLVTLNPLFGTLWLDPLIEKIRSTQLVYMKLFYVCIAASVCCKCRWHPSLSMSAPIL